MKKFISLIACCTIAVSAHVHAQKSRVAITAGSTIASYKISSEGVSVKSKGKPGFTVGLMTDIPIGSAGSFMPALNYVQKGGKFEMEGIEDKLTTNYFEIPLNFTYNLKMSTGKWFIGGGPALNFGISGKEKWSSSTESGSEKIKFGKDEDFKRFDAGLNFVTGIVSKKGMMISFNYNAGLTNSVDTDGEDGKFKNRYFALRVGYFL